MARGIPVAVVVECWPLAIVVLPGGCCWLGLEPEPELRHSAQPPVFAIVDDNIAILGTPSGVIVERSPP